MEQKSTLRSTRLTPETEEGFLALVERIEILEEAVARLEQDAETE